MELKVSRILEKAHLIAYTWSSTWFQVLDTIWLRHTLSGIQHCLFWGQLLLQDQNHKSAKSQKHIMQLKAHLQQHINTYTTNPRFIPTPCFSLIFTFIVFLEKYNYVQWGIFQDYQICCFYYVNNHICFKATSFLLRKKTPFDLDRCDNFQIGCTFSPQISSTDYMLWRQRKLTSPHKTDLFKWS